MEKLKLIKPTKEYEAQAKEYIAEFIEYNSRMNGVGGLNEDIDNYDLWLEKIARKRLKQEIDDVVSEETFMLVRENDNKLIGMTNIRLGLNEKLRNRGGNIGYGIRPTERRKGYNSYQLYLALQYCNLNNIKRVLMTCAKSNLASAKTIQNSYGVLVEEFIDHNDNDELVQKYWIDTKKAIKKLSKKYEIKK